MHLKKNYISNVSAQSLGRVCSMGANLVVFVLAARLLGTEAFGQYSYVTVFLGLAILVAEFGTTSVLASDIAQVGEEASAYWGNFLILRFSIALLVTAIGIPVAWLARPDLYSSILVGLLGLFFLGSRFFEPIFQVTEHPWYSFWGSVVYSLVFALLSVIALLLKRPLFDLFTCYVLANIVYTIFAGWLSTSLIKPSFTINWTIQKSILTLAIPIGIATILALIHTRADTFMLSVMKGDHAVGIYNGAYRFLDMAVIVAVMLSTPMLPIFSKMVLDSRESLRRRYAQILELLTSVIVPVAILVPLLSDLVVALLFGPEYREVGPLLDIMAWIGVLTFYSMFNFAILVAIKVVRFQVWLSGVAAFLNVVLNYFFIPSFSFYGSAWATLIVECIFVAVSFLYIIQSIGNIFDYSIWWRICLACLLLVLVVQGSAGLNMPLRILLALIAWPGSLMLLRVPFKKTLTG
jgi:O-antigen/teichoic acid export membrane protein